jgi:hypothetical protein
MDRGETARRIGTKRLAALGIQLANADHAWYANPDCSGNRFTGQDAIRAPRWGPRHLHDQPSSADQSRRSVIILGSARVSRAGFGFAPKRTFLLIPIAARICEQCEKFANPRRVRQHARRVRSRELLSSRRWFSMLLKFAAASR